MFRRAAASGAACGAVVLDRYHRASASAVEQDHAARLDKRWLAEETKPGYVPPDASWPKQRPHRADVPSLRASFQDCGGVEAGARCHALGAALAFGLLGGVLFGHALEPEEESSTADAAVLEAEASEGASLLADLANGGSAEAACGYAMCLLEGTGVAEDGARGIAYLQMSADAGYQHAQHALGCAFYLGEGTAVDEQRAVHWLQCAAAQGHPNAMFLLGECLLEVCARLERAQKRCTDLP